MASKFAQDLEQLLTRIQEEPLTLNDLLEETAEASFLLLIALLAAPFLIPVPPGFTTVPCLVSLLLSLQMVAGRRSPWLPDRLKRISFPQRPGYIFRPIPYQRQAAEKFPHKNHPPERLPCADARSPKEQPVPLFFWLGGSCGPNHK